MEGRGRCDCVWRGGGDVTVYGGEGRCDCVWRGGGGEGEM